MQSKDYEGSKMLMYHQKLRISMWGEIKAKEKFQEGQTIPVLYLNLLGLIVTVFVLFVLLIHMFLQKLFCASTYLRIQDLKMHHFNS